jgi:type II secretory pathway predicted ATPase ExeA
MNSPTNLGVATIIKKEEWLMYKAYWGMEFNPFAKEISEKQFYHGADYKEAMKRLEHLKNIRGIGLFTGMPGAGKTVVLRSFVNGLNPSLYKVVYIQMTTISVNEFYRELAISLGLTPSFRKSDNFRLIQERIRQLYRDQRITLLVLIDEAQYLKHDVLADLKLLMNFEMDSQNYAVLVLCGLPILNSRITLQIHEALYQRIVISYDYFGLSHDEVKDYVVDRLKLCGIKQPIFKESAYEAAHGHATGSIRKLNTLLAKALMIGCEREAKEIDTEIIMDAKSEIDLHS